MFIKSGNYKEIKGENIMEGWVKIHRKIVDWEWYNDTNVKVVFFHLLLTANYKKQQWKGQIILRGQKLTSIEHLADDVGLSTQQTRTALKKLKSTHEITMKTTNKNTLITIEKFNNYQFETDEDNNPITNNQQTNNKQITTNKNIKNVNNVKNKKEQEEKIHFAEFVSMTNAEYEKLVSTYGKDFVDQCITVLDNYKGSSGKTYKSDYRAILNWVIDENKQRQEKKESNQTKNYNNYTQRQYKDLNNLYANKGG